MKNLTPAGIASLVTLPALTMQQAAVIVGGSSEPTQDIGKPKEPAYTTSSGEPPNAGAMRPPLA